MSGTKPQIQERHHTKGRILEQLRSGAAGMSTLHSVPLLRVWKPIPSKDVKVREKAAVRELRKEGIEIDEGLAREANIFPPADYGWFEHPSMHDDCYSVLAPRSTLPYWKSIKYDSEAYNSAGKYDFNIDEDFMCDLRLTKCEASRFQQGCAADEGMIAVLRDITRPVFEMLEDNTQHLLRAGIRWIVMDPTDDTDVLDTSTVGNRILDHAGSKHSGLPMKDVPLEYVERMALPGGFGVSDLPMEQLGRLELERRRGIQKATTPQPELAPPEEPKPSNGNGTYACSATNANGKPCKASGTYVDPAGDHYCHIHKKKSMDMIRGVDRK